MKFGENINLNLDKLINNKKAIILIPGVIVIVIAITLLIMALTETPPETDNQPQTLLDTKESIISELYQTRQYLAGLEDNIADNWKILTQDNSVSHLNETLVDTSEFNTSLEIESLRLQNIFANKVSTLIGDFEKLKVQIGTAQEMITEILKLMDIAFESSRTEIMNKLNFLNDRLKNLKSDYVEMREDINNFYAEFSEMASERQAELLETLRLLSEQMEAGNNENLTVLNESITKLEILNQETLEIMNTINRNQESIENMNNTNQQAIENMNNSNQKAIENINNTNREVFENINNTNRETFVNINNSNQEVFGNMTNINQEAFKGLDLTINKQLNELNRDLTLKIAETQDDISGQLTVHDTYVRDRLYGVSDKMCEMEGRINNLIDTRVNLLQSRLNDVFQSVSNGKTLLATALLTKGQTVADGAKFQEIYEAILRIETTIVVDNMPGDIVFEYHYHVDSTGFVIDSLTHTCAGGCFNIPIWHLHTDSGNTQRDADFKAPNSGGCFQHHDFKANTSHIHTNCLRARRACGWCSGHSHTNGVTGCGVGGHPPSTWVHNGHHVNCGRSPQGACNSSNGCREGDWTCNNLPLNSGGWSHWILDCGKTTNTIEYYSLDCGRLHGQIVGAHITW